MIDDLIARLAEHWDLGAMLGAALFVTAFIGAVVTYCLDPAQAGARSLRGFVRFLLPRSVFLHRSAINDYLFAIIHKLTYPFLIAPAIAAGAALAHGSLALAESWLGPPVHRGDAWGASLVFTVLVLVLLNDFWFFWFHRLEHRVWWLWEFHKAHHAAEAMAWGITARRNHPVDEIVHSFGAALLPGIAGGLFAYFWNADVTEVLIHGVSIWALLEIIGFRHLKHSHIYLRFPRWLEYVLVSPAMHQIHHSREERHWDRNFSTMFAFWDVLYRSWFPSEPTPNFRIGLARDEAKLFNRSVLHVYFYSFSTLWREMRRRRIIRRALPPPQSETPALSGGAG
jgi:sterol desaturase/sphingolipid hydroxylase (fatty acid hydroxylase superfamily)